MGLTFRLAALALVLFSASLPARADWTGTLKIKTEPAVAPGEGEQGGTISGKGSKMRVDVERKELGGRMSLILDHKTHVSTMVMDAQKAFLTIDMDQMRKSAFAPVKCEKDDSDAASCLAQSGFTKTGTETVNGKKSDRWESDRINAAGEKSHDKLWVPQGVKGFAMVRQETQSEKRHATVDVLDFKELSLPATQFEAPAGYTNATGKMRPGMDGAPGPHGPPGH